jgi:hypothetical protein
MAKPSSLSFSYFLRAHGLQAGPAASAPASCLVRDSISHVLAQLSPGAQPSRQLPCSAPAEVAALLLAGFGPHPALAKAKPGCVHQKAMRSFPQLMVEPNPNPN